MIYADDKIDEVTNLNVFGYRDIDAGCKDVDFLTDRFQTEVILCRERG